MQFKKLEGSQEQWKHASTPWNNFFISLHFSHKHSEGFPTIFLCPITISPLMNSKISKNQKEIKINGKTFQHHEIIFLFQ